MRDLFLVYAYEDESLATGLRQTFADRGLELADSVSLWPSDRILKLIGQGLSQARYAVILITDDFLGRSYSGFILDALARREQVISLLCGVDEDDVSPHSDKLAVAAIPGCYHEAIIRLVRDPA
jgi:hypothetical protein